MSTNRNADTHLGRTGHQVATKAERDSLVVARPKPAVELHLSPGGTIETTVRQSLNARQEARIQHIQTRLDSASQRLNQDRGKAMVRGTAKADFDRSR